MGSVAAAMSERGFTVTGSDENVYPPMSTFLEERNVALFSGYRAENIPAKADVVVIGNAIKRGNPEGEAVLNRKLFYLSLPAAIALLSCSVRPRSLQGAPDGSRASSRACKSGFIQL